MVCLPANGTCTLHIGLRSANVLSALNITYAMPRVAPVSPRLAPSATIAIRQNWWDYRDTC